VLDLSPPQRAWPVPDRLGAEPAEKLKGRRPNHGGHKRGEGPKGRLSGNSCWCLV